ncbi:hypothetical protein F9K85_14265 [Brucella tritici]|uniref:Uncharacterized protein n=1 Tax=Brucella tritici TaxID=94626 RepID=A0A6N6QF46_9HYPH|nr:hypothetical protein [Brucella tritici]KAB2675537.1 hypothetical protein F9K85_14265 [Brucella tritici]KAB2684283.1 hypothetical protein F9L08_14820 [Brucella tritici]
MKNNAVGSRKIGSGKPKQEIRSGKKGGITNKSNVNTICVVKTKPRNTSKLHSSSLKNIQNSGVQNRYDTAKEAIVTYKSSLLTALDELRDAITSDRGGYRTNLRRNLATSYELAFRMKMDPDCKLQFESHLEWENFANIRISKKDPVSLLVAVLGYVFGYQTREKKKKVSKLKRALEPYFVHDIDPGEVAAIVLKGGASALLKKAGANSGGDHKHEAHSKKKRATEAKLEFDFNPGKYRELFRHLDRPLSAQVELEFVPKLNGRRAVKVVSLKATA